MKMNMILGCLLSMALLGGCAGAAVGAAAGAVGAIAYTDRGAKGNVKGDVKTVDYNARHVLSEMGLKMTETSSKESGNERSVSAKGGGKDVTVQMKSSGDKTTAVEVVVQEGPVKWNKDYARDLLSRIVAES